MNPDQLRAESERWATFFADSPNEARMKDHIAALQARVEALEMENARLLAEKSNGRITEAQILMVQKWAATAEKCHDQQEG